MCLYGVGLDLDWENLWRYRMVHAQAAMAFLQDHYFKAKGRDVYFSHPLDKEQTMDVLTAWVTSYSPLCLQHYLMEYNKIR